MRIFVFIILFGISISEAFASHGDTLKVHEVVIIDYVLQEIPLISSFKIDSNTKSNYSDCSLAELLNKTTSLSFKNYGAGGSSTISFRGTNSSHTKVLWNGLSIGSPMLGMLDFSIIPSNLADEVIVQSGAATALVGTGALGGVILINTIPNFNINHQINLSYNFNTLNSNQIHLKVIQTKNKFQSITQFQINSNLNSYEFNNYTEFGNPKQKQKNAEVKQGGLIQQFFYRTHNSIISFHAWYQESDRNIGPPLFNRNQLSYQLDHSLRSLISIEKTISTKTFWKSTISYNREYIRYVNRINNGGNIFILLNTKSYFDAISHQSEIKRIWKNVQQGLGYEINFEGASVEDYGSYRSRYRASVFSNSQIKFSKRNQIQFINRIERAIQNTLMANQFSYKRKSIVLQGLDATINFSKNYNLPTMNDLYWIPGGNPNLNPEKGLEAAIKLDYQVKKPNWECNFSINYYQSIINDWILWQPSAIENGVWTPQNLRQVKLKGLEIYEQLSFHTYKIQHYLTGNYAINHAINNKSTSNNDVSVGKQLIYVPIEKANLNYRILWNGFQLTYGISRIGYRFTTSDNLRFLPSYVLHEIGIGKNFHLKNQVLVCNIRIDNLNNVYYESIPNRPVPGRTYCLNISYQLNYKHKSQK